MYLELATRVTKQGQVTIPISVREFLGIKTMDKVSFKREGTRVYISPVQKLDSLAGSIKVDKPLDMNLVKKSVLKYHRDRYDKTISN